jgi:hypothetical protein
VDTDGPPNAETLGLGFDRIGHQVARPAAQATGVVNATVRLLCSPAITLSILPMGIDKYARAVLSSPLSRGRITAVILVKT